MNPDGEDGLMRRIKKCIKNVPLVAIPVMFFRVLRGFSAYRRILKACPPEEGWRVYFMDYDGSGDTYLTCGYLQSKGQLDSNTAFAASGNLSLKIAKLFPFGRYTNVAPKAALTVRMMERFLCQRLILLPLLYESDYLEYSGIFRRMAGFRGLNFMSMLKIGLEANCGLPYDEMPWKQPRFPYEQAELDKVFEKYNLVPGKTVVLAPYAGKHDMWGIPMAFYAMLAERLRAAGYTVCTNLGDVKKEPPVPGTVPLLVPHRLMRPFCEAAGGFTGFRSGLCDMISAAHCKKVVLYSPNIQIVGIVPHYEFFSLKNMELCSDVVEIEFDIENSKRIIERIVRQFL